MESAILNTLPDPIILLNENREVVGANSAAEDLIGEAYLNRELAFSLRHPDLLAAVDTVLNGAEPDVTRISMSHPVPRSFEMYVTAIVKSGHEIAGVTQEPASVLVVLHDVTTATHAEEFRKDFIANLSHELRSPLSSLLGFIETLQGTAQDDLDTRKRFLAIMQHEANRMRSLIDDLLSLAKIEANEHIRPDGVVHLKNVIAMVCEPLAPKAEGRHMPIDVDVRGDVPAINGDHNELFQVFNNLIDNAIKYGEEKTPVTVVIEAVDRIPHIGTPGVSVAITNQGEPIPMEQIPRLTERFYRVDEGRSRSMGGTGLGLAIVKHMVNHHRGRLAIESLPEKGTTFTVFLPL